MPTVMSAREDLRGYLASGYTVVIICENQLSAQNLHGLLDGDGIPAVLYMEAALRIRVSRL